MDNVILSKYVSVIRLKYIPNLIFCSDSIVKMLSRRSVEERDENGLTILNSAISKNR